MRWSCPIASSSTGSRARARGPKPRGRATFRPLMLAQPLEEDELAGLNPADFMAEWKWDGVRVQIVGEGTLAAALFALGRRDDGDISRGGRSRRRRRHAGRRAAGDARRRGRRLRRSAEAAQPQEPWAPKLLQDYPVGVRLYDILFEGAEDLRACPSPSAAARLESWYAASAAAGLRSVAADRLRATGRSWPSSARAISDPGIEGLMLKRADSPYLAGRPDGPMVQMEDRSQAGRMPC